MFCFLSGAPGHVALRCAGRSSNGAARWSVFPGALLSCDGESVTLGNAREGDVGVQGGRAAPVVEGSGGLLEFFCATSSFFFFCGCSAAAVRRRLCHYPRDRTRAARTRTFVCSAPFLLAARASQALSCSGRSFFPHPLSVAVTLVSLGSSSPPSNYVCRSQTLRHPGVQNSFPSLSAGPFLSRVSRCRQHSAFFLKSSLSFSNLLGEEALEVSAQAQSGVCGLRQQQRRYFSSATKARHLTSLSTPFQDPDYRLDDLPVTHRRTSQENTTFRLRRRPIPSRPCVIDV